MNMRATITFVINLIGINSSICKVLSNPFLHFSNNGPDTAYEIIYLPLFPLQQSLEFDDSYGYHEPIYYNFSAFGRSVLLNLKPNNHLIAPNFKVIINDNDYETQYDKTIDRNCFYLHKDDDSVAAFNLCEPNSVHGLVFLGNSTLEINPLNPLNPHYEIASEVPEALEQLNINDFNEPMFPHIVKRTPFIREAFVDDYVQMEQNYFRDDFREKRAATKFTIELAMFFDEAAFKIFAPYFKYDEKKITDMLLAYMNGVSRKTELYPAIQKIESVPIRTLFSFFPSATRLFSTVQALYHHPSLGRSVELAMVRLEIMKKQPKDMPHHNGERSQLLDSFCDYQRSKNPTNDNNPEHWDMALYVSGLDFFAYENGRKSGVTMGLATVGGVCLEKFNCVIAELGTTNVFGKPYPSAGFTSVYILAHEIGHNLGMHHDSSGNSCPKEGYIMSPSRGTTGETIWSSCSADVMTRLNYATCLLDKPVKSPSNLNHNKFLDTPGQKYGAKKQCEILLRDKDATLLPSQKLSEICYNLQCKTPHRSGYYHAGPALEGTECGRGKWCQGGSCIKAVRKKPVTVTPGGWGPWKSDQCSSGCLRKSKGFKSRRRECNNPKPVNTDEGCEGSSYDIVLCNDSNFCERRMTPEAYASTKCQEFSKMINELDPNGFGLQAPHEKVRLWMGCTIFCRRADSTGYYTPRIELNDLNISPYFPDGTWCHNDGDVDYYCLHHHCLPENFQFTKTSLLHGMGEDIPIPQNANPSQIIPPELQLYLSLGPDGKPLQTSLRPNQLKPSREEEWETKDYVDLPMEFNESQGFSSISHDNMKVDS